MYAETPFFASDLDRVSDEALPGRVVDLGKTHHRDVHATGRDGGGGDFRQPARIGMGRIEVVFGCGVDREQRSPCPFPR